MSFNCEHSNMTDHRMFSRPFTSTYNNIWDGMQSYYIIINCTTSTWGRKWVNCNCGWVLSICHWHSNTIQITSFRRECECKREKRKNWIEGDYTLSWWWEADETFLQSNNFICVREKKKKKKKMGTWWCGCHAIPWGQHTILVSFLVCVYIYKCNLLFAHACTQIYTHVRKINIHISVMEEGKKNISLVNNNIIIKQNMKVCIIIMHVSSLAFSSVGRSSDYCNTIWIFFFAPTTWLSVWSNEYIYIYI